MSDFSLFSVASAAGVLCPLSLAALFVGLIADVLFGDPPVFYHPVCHIGNWIGWLRKRLYVENGSAPVQERRGIILWLLTVPVWFFGTKLALGIFYFVHPAIGFAAESFWCFQLLAGHSLKKESRKVYAALKESNLPAAKNAVAMIVGRDTADMDEQGVIRAAVETVAENTSDGIVAPMIFMLLFGAPGGFLYKAVNTLDSMVGYKNEEYIYFGRFSARMDDLFNWVPARISGLCMIVSAFVCGYDGRGAWRIYVRDRRNHASPNSAQTESACAGALGIRLGGGASYFGVYVDKPTIGDAGRRAEPDDIIRAGRLMDGTWITAAAILFLLTALWRSLRIWI